MLFGTPKRIDRLLQLSLWVGLCVVLIAIPAVAYAYNFSMPDRPMEACPSLPGFTKRLVVCFRDTMLSTVNGMLGTVVSTFYGAMTGAATLAIAILGFQMAGGRTRSGVSEGGLLLLKIGAMVVLFGSSSYGFVELFSKMLDVTDELLGYVTSSVGSSTSLRCSAGNDNLAVWDRVDCALNVLVGGVLPASTVAVGITAFFSAAVVTDAPGFLIGFAGFLMIIQILFAMARALYIYILSYFAFAMMAMMAPIFVPMVLFNFSRGYFEKWLKLSLGFILQPMFIFAYLAMLLSAFDTVVYSGSDSLYNTIIPGGGASGSFIGEKLKDKAYMQGSKGNASVVYDSEHASSTSPTTGPGGGRALVYSDKETGVSGKVAEVPTTDAQWNQVGFNGVKNIYQTINKSAGSPLGIDPFFFHISLPTKQLDWTRLAGCTSARDKAAADACIQEYVVKVLFSLVMALITSYIFLKLLNALPFIGSGITSDAVSSGGGFGFGSLAPPGEGIIKGMGQKIMGGS